MELQTVLIRLAMAVLCGGLIGVEREKKKRPAGLRTYILVCTGATLVMMTSEYIFSAFHTGDPARMGAQVISGIGFLGAGTIIVTSQSRVRGLTTAAGLWAAACMGLAIGIGFYTGALVACLLILVVMGGLYRFDTRIMTKSSVMSIYVEFEQIPDITHFMIYVKEQGVKIHDLEINRREAVSENGVVVLFSLRLPQKRAHAEWISELGMVEGVRFIQEV